MNKYLLGLFSLLCILPAQAAVVDNLYQADITVPSQSKEDWQKALPGALDQVATKVSGNADIKINEQMRKSLPDIASLVQSYSYSKSANTTILHVHFDSHAVDNLLNRVGKPIWGDNRPLTLIWLTTKTGQTPTILGNNPTDPTLTVMQTTADNHGLPILWPEMDLQDVTQLQTNDVVNFNAVALQRASQRYHADTILAGNLSQTAPDSWQGQWLYISPTGQTTSWTTQGNDANKVVEAAVDKLGNALMGQIVSTTPSQPATQQVMVSSNAPQSTLTLKIVNVDGLDDYADVVKYVRNLGSVASVEASQVDADFVVLTVTVNGGADALSKDISVNQKLLPQTSENPEELVYRWQASRMQSASYDDGVRL